MDLDDPAPNSLFAFKLHYWGKIVPKWIPEFLVNLVHHLDMDFLVVSGVTKYLPHMRPVPLFNMSVVILLIGPSSDEVHFVFSIDKVIVEIVIEELVSIVGSKTLDRKW